MFHRCVKPGANLRITNSTWWESSKKGKKYEEEVMEKYIFDGEA